MSIFLRPRKRLHDMDIDEISLVDAGANQHAAIVFSKARSPEEDYMSDFYDAYGNVVEDVDLGDVVYDAEGNEYEIVMEDDLYEGDDYYDEDYDEFGKAFNPIQSAKNFGRGFKRRKDFYKNPGGPEGGLGRAGEAGRQFGEAVNMYGKRTAIGTGLVAGGAAAGYGAGRFQKSLSDVVMEELSKAASEDERSYVISKAMEEVEIAKAAAAEAWDRVAEQEDAQLEYAFISKAAEYNLPVDPGVLGQILKSASTVLSGDQLDVLDALFTGIGDTLYEELGYVGDTDNASVLDVVDSYVGDLVSKSGQYSPEMLTTAVFDSNPDAYDAYLAEQNWR